MESDLYCDSLFMLSLSLVIIRPVASCAVQALSHVLCSHYLCLWESWKAVVIRTDSGVVLFCLSFSQYEIFRGPWLEAQVTLHLLNQCPGLWDLLHRCCGLDLFAKFIRDAPSTTELNFGSLSGDYVMKGPPTWMGYITGDGCLSWKWASVKRMNSATPTLASSRCLWAHTLTLISFCLSLWKGTLMWTLIMGNDITWTYQAHGM